MSQATIDYANSQTEGVSRLYGGVGRASMRLVGLGTLEDPAIDRLFYGVVPAALEGRWDECVTKLLPFAPIDRNSVAALSRLHSSPMLTQYVIQLLAINGSPPTRQFKTSVVRLESLWPKVWLHDIEALQAQGILNSLSGEITYQAQKGADDDIAYLSELGKRIASGLLVAKDPPPGLRESAAALVAAAAQIYPSIANLKPTKEGPPDVLAVLAEVAARAKDFKPIEVDVRTMHQTTSTQAPRRSRPAGRDS